MRLEIECLMCAKEKTIKIETTELDPGATVRRLIEGAEWIVQQNGPNFDIYCSKRCAA